MFAILPKTTEEGGDIKRKRKKKKNPKNLKWLQLLQCKLGQWKPCNLKLIWKHIYTLFKAEIIIVAAKLKAHTSCDMDEAQLCVVD